MASNFNDSTNAAFAAAIVTAVNFNNNAVLFLTDLRAANGIAGYTVFNVPTSWSSFPVVSLATVNNDDLTARALRQVAGSVIVKYSVPGPGPGARDQADLVEVQRAANGG